MAPSSQTQAEEAEGEKAPLAKQKAVPKKKKRQKKASEQNSGGGAPEEDEDNDC